MNNLDFYNAFAPNSLEQAYSANNESEKIFGCLESGKHSDIDLSVPNLRKLCLLTLGESYGRRNTEKYTNDSSLYKLFAQGLLKLDNKRSNKQMLQAKKIIESVINSHTVNATDMFNHPLFLLQKDYVDKLLLSALFDKNILEVIKQYLGTNSPCIYSPTYLFTPIMQLEHISQEKLCKNAFQYHRDMPGSKSLKIFVQISDKLHSGFHYYVANSHVWSQAWDGKKNTPRNPKFNGFNCSFNAESTVDTFLYDGRFSDESITSLFGKSQICRLGGNFGDTWIEDNYGLHKGSPCFHTPRIIATILITKHPTRPL